MIWQIFITFLNQDPQMAINFSPCRTIGGGKAEHERDHCPSIILTFIHGSDLTRVKILISRDVAINYLNGL